VAERITVVVDCVLARIDGRDQLTEVLVRPITAAHGNDGERFLIAFREVRVAEASASSENGGTGAERQLRLKVAAMKQRLQAMIDELEASNSDHRRANERLRTANEELQASQEELESLNEELQTVNGELSAKVDELDRAHADLQNLLRSTDVAVVFLSKELALKKFTPAATRLFRLMDSDVGRPISDISARFPVEGLLRELKEVLEGSSAKERPVQVGETGRWYNVRVGAYVTVTGSTDGAVITFTDITDAKLAESASRESEARLRQIVDSLPHLVWTATPDGTREYFSQQWRGSCP
jgi:two-component system CheB/CheR fusion protein